MTRTPWWRTVGPGPWKALVAAQVGWALDAMDVMLYAFALDAIKQEFALGSSGVAGAIASATLLAAAAGGIAFGFLADRFGRARMLMVSVLVYSAATALAATSQDVWQLLLWRTLVGIGMGGEWTTGAVLVAETWPAAHRGKAVGLMQSGFAIGYILAAALAAAILPTLGWRALFAVGVLPALFAAWIRRSVPEPEIWRRGRAIAPEARTPIGSILRPPLLARTAAATVMASALLFAYWGVFTWIPSFLALPADRGGANLGIVKSAGWIVAMQTGAFFGYVSFGFLADRFGRKPTFVAFVLGAAAITPLYGGLRAKEWLLALGPILGFVGHGYFSVFGALLAEIFPSAIRGAAQGLVYNVGRAVSAFAPAFIGLLADDFGIGAALGAMSAFYVLGAVAMAFLPDTRGKELA